MRVRDALLHLYFSYANFVEIFFCDFVLVVSQGKVLFVVWLSDHKVKNFYNLNNFKHAETI